MKTLKIFVLAIITFSFSINCATAQTRQNKNVKKTNQPPIDNRQKISERKPPIFVSDDDGANVKTLAEGTISGAAMPFVFTARSPETFAELQNLIKNLPSEDIDFNKTAVVAAFAGTKNTGGYSVDIEKNADKVSIKVAAPPKNAMVTQMITSPYKVALVEIERENSLNLDLSADFSNAVKNYRVTSGEFEFSGGIAGTRKKFQAQGTIGVLRFGEYVTLMFNLTGKGGDGGRKLNEAASGAIKDGKINVARVEAGDFIDRPHPPLVAAGTLSSGKLSLAFEPDVRGYVVNDGYAGGGKIEAVKIKR